MDNMRKLFVLAVIILISAASIAEAKGVKRMDQQLSITSPVFKDSQTFPIKYSGLGDDINPPLQITGVSAKAKSLVLIFDDIDAPGRTFDHWILFNIPPSVSKINAATTPVGAKLGRNSAGEAAYMGPNPPPGKPHHYTFRLYALDRLLDLENGTGRNDIENAMKGHIVGKASLVGLFGK
jgi:Raf kinase inhibitor-like YbhB/YbcL family protein